MSDEDTVEVREYWFRERGNPYGWYDRWVEVPALGIRHGINYPALRRDRWNPYVFDFVAARDTQPLTPGDTGTSARAQGSTTE